MHSCNRFWRKKVSNNFHYQLHFTVLLYKPMQNLKINNTLFTSHTIKFATCLVVTLVCTCKASKNCFQANRYCQKAGRSIMGTKTWRRKIKNRSCFTTDYLIHSVLEGLQLSVERGVQMLFSDRNGSNPRPFCNNEMLLLDPCL